jgi:Type I phosphodiesterase / nucleotide pyrophosphatase
MPPPRSASLLAVLALAALPATASAQAQPLDDPARPLVFVLSLDGLDGDRLDAGKAPFIGSLLQGSQDAQATYWRESRSVMVAETNPNHVAMATGAFGDRSGIPGNAFAVYSDASKRACGGGGEDGNDPPGAQGGQDESGGPAEQTDGERAQCLLAETFFAAVKRQAGDRITTAGIFGKPKLARIFAGRKATPGRYDADYLWTPCVEEGESPYCKQVPARPNDSYALFDRDVMDEVLRSVREGVRGDGRTFSGGGPRPNLTFVNLPGVDSSGHGTGRGPVYDATVAAADDEIERFVAQQKQLGLWGRSVLVLLSDHSMEATPERTSLSVRFTAAGISPDDYTVVQNGSAAFVYAVRRDAGRFALLERLRAAALGDSAAPLAGPPAAEALYREPNPEDGGSAHTLGAVHPAWRLDGERTGDLVVSARGPDGAFNEPNPLTGNHGGPQTRDNFFAVIGGGKLVRSQSLAGSVDAMFDDTLANPGQAENVDVAPTVMRLFGLQPPRDNSGRFLSEAFQLGGAPGGGRPRR